MDHLSASRQYVIEPDNYISTLRSMIDKTVFELSDLPGGTLYIKKNRKKVQYYHRIGGPGDHRIYIKQDNIALAARLAQKNYDQKLLKLLNSLLDDAYKASNLSGILYVPKNFYAAIDNIFFSLSCERQRLVTPIIPTTKQFVKEWLDEPYEKKGFHPDDTSAYFTRNGERVRSKSELYIADTIDYAGIPCKYECPLILGSKVLHPDFTLLDVSSRQVKYLEHCGMMDNPDYSDSFIWKINFYQSHGIIPGDNLILTFESSNRPLDTRIIDNILEYHFPAIKK